MVGLAAMFCSAALAVGAPRQSESFTVTLSAPSQPLKAGRPLLLRVTLTNASNRETHVLLNAGSSDVAMVYQVHVLDEQGHPAPPWVPPPPPKGKTVERVGSIHGTELKPGESQTDWVNVTDVYDLSRPGKYTIWIAERFGRGPHDFVKSNAVTVTVVK